MGIQAINFATMKAAGGGGGGRVADFLAATSIVDSTIENALIDLDAAFEADGLWSKMIAFYPFVGGDATKHSYNLADTSLFQITWAGTVTHDANGITPDGSTGWGDTGISPVVDITPLSSHLSFYCRSAAPSNSYQIGCWSSGATRRFQLGANTFNANWYYATSYAEASDRLQGAYPSGDARGQQLQTRRSSTDFEVYRNATLLDSSATVPATDFTSFTDTIYVGGMNQAGTGASSNGNLASASVGLGLTATDVANMNTAIQAFQTDLSRNV